MSTIDLGKIKFVWRGAYNNSTAYTPDDVVSSGGSSYICILASTGNAVSNGTYWSLLAQGGTDVGATLTTQGDLLYRDGSGLQRLAKPGSTMFLQMTSGGVPSWSAVSSDFVKISQVAVAAAGEIAFNNVTSSDYKHYKLELSQIACSNTGADLYLRFRNGTTNLTANEYFTTYHSSYYNGTNGGVNNNNDRSTYMRLANWNQPGYNNTYGSNWHFDFGDLTQDYPKVSGSHAAIDGNFDNIINIRMAGIYNVVSAGQNGFTLYWSNGANFSAQGTATLYGLK